MYRVTNLNGDLLWFHPFFKGFFLLLPNDLNQKILQGFEFSFLFLSQAKWAGLKSEGWELDLNAANSTTTEPGLPILALTQAKEKFQIYCAFFVSIFELENQFSYIQSASWITLDGLIFSIYGFWMQRCQIEKLQVYCTNTLLFEAIVFAINF